MNIRETLRAVAHNNPRALGWDEYDIPRIAFNIGLALNGRHPKGLSIADLGGGVGLFSIGCKAVGFQRSVLVDDFGDPVNSREGMAPLAPHWKAGVEIVSRDVVRDGIADLGRFDAITTFDSMEHWHHSPKALFAQVAEALNPGGVFVLGVPNCANLRKRLTVPLGLAKWSSMSDWYESPSFRGHVREPDVGDLRYIARDMGLADIRVIGRNWQGYNSRNRLIRACAKIADIPLRAMPSLCADIYLVGLKGRPDQPPPGI